ncbi:MAG: RNase adapter RapZ [Oscillospiraceae bacterium]|nr:RNase adapter RapZ [Oscillospiraceae bacterium]
MELIVITGLSGAGKSSVAGILEDLDFYCVDNMPVSMMPKLVELCMAAHGKYERVALVTDVRALESVNELFGVLSEIRDLGCAYQILFIEAEVETIVRRYKETRRRHPINLAGRSLEETVKSEIEMLMPLREQAHEIIDTTTLTRNNLQLRLIKQFMEGNEQKALSVTIKSFGFKHGLPIEADMLFDVRFMPNPYYDLELRDKSGLDDPVRDYVFSLESSQGFFVMLCDMIEFLLPNYIEEGKRYLVICIGCTGGRHRSPAIAQELAGFLTDKGYQVDCIHRDIEKE